MRVRRTFTFATAFAVVASSLLGAVPAPAGAAGATSGACTQRAADRPHDEWLSCVGVRVSLVRAPALGEEAVVEVTVTSDHDQPSLAVQLETSAAMPYVGVRGVRTAARADGAERVQRVGAATPLRAHGTRTLRYRVRATATGTMHLRAVARAVVSNDRTDAASDDVFVTVGRTRSASRLGASSRTGGVLPTTAVDPNRPLQIAPAGRRARVRVAGVPRAQARVRVGVRAPAGQSCATGGWFYLDNNGTRRPAVNETVEAWDKDFLSTDDLLAVGTVGWDGSYRLCFNNDDGDPFSAGIQEVYIHFVTSNTVWRVRDTALANNNYVFNSGAPVTICDTCEQSYGNLQPADASVQRGLHAFDALNDLWNKVHGANGCFDPNDGSCRQMVLNWTSTSSDGTYYSLGGNDIHLAAADPDAPTTVVHEGSHAVMDDLYEDAFPASPSCNPHSIFGVSSQGCAWTEGFAEWLPAMVYNDPFYRWPSGASLNLEAPTWGDGNPTGDALEGRIAGTMIDISDSNNDAYWDFGGEGFDPQWNTLVNQVSNTLNEFLTVDRPAQGFSADDSLVLSSAYQNTIDYGFRDPLATRAVLTRPTPAVPLNYSFAAPSSYWSVVAQRSPAASDYDMRIYSDRALGTLVTGSLGTTPVDFIAIDGNRAGARTWYPQSTRFSGSGTYPIEGVAGSISLGATGSGTFAATDLIDVRDVYQPSGVTMQYRVVPSASTDISLHLMSGASATQAVQRAAAMVTMNASGAGGEEVLAASESSARWDGLVIVNESPGVAGTFTLYRDATAPTGSITIGATNPAATNTRSVTLALAATDAETGVRDMRISTDGVFDTEPWVPFAATMPLTLSSGAGVKTVSVQYRNNANMTAVQSDTITYDTRPNLRVTAISAPPAAGLQGSSFTVFDTTRNSGPTTDGVPTTTEYVLSLNGTRDASDVVLGSRSVLTLPAGVSDVSATTTVSVPMTTRAGSYYLMACADSTALVAEFSETDNCKISATKITITTPDYAIASVTNPPAASSLGGTFTITDTTKNVGTAAAVVASVDRYYLSFDTVVNAGDVLLGTSRGVAALAAGATNSGTKTLTIPLAAAHGTYRVIVCADYYGVITETSETNNCKASSTTVTF